MTPERLAELIDVKERHANNLGRIQALQEVIAYHTQVRPNSGEELGGWEAAARAFAEADVSLTQWMTAALDETLTESRLILEDMKRFNGQA